MGDYNATCFLTRLPIMPGDRAIALLVIPRPEPDLSGVHCDGIWVPCILPFTGPYDGYGKIEKPEDDQAARAVLAGSGFRILADGNQYISLDTDAFGRDGWEETLQTMLAAAVAGNLEVRTGDGSGRNAYARCLLQLAHAWAWAGICDPYESRYLDLEPTTRLRLAGPLRDAARRLQFDPYGYEAKRIRKTAGAAAAMDDLRIAYGPTSGAGSQDDGTQEWQREFRKNTWLRSEAARYAGYGAPPAPFSAAMAWDGNYVQCGTDGEPDRFPDVPDGSPADVAFGILSAAVDNITDAMEDAGEAEEEDGGE